MQDAWYYRNRYGALWEVFASKAKLRPSRRARREKPMHLVLNELRQRGEFTAIEAWKLIEEDMKLLYDHERIQGLVADFLERHPEVKR